MIYGKVFLEAAVKSSSLYFISEKKNLKELKPRVPNNYFTKNGFEDGTIARVCFAKSVAKSLMALSYSCAGKIFYVYQPAKEYMTYKPTTKEVPDCKITGEIWIREPVELKCIGKIKCTKDAGKPGHKFKYGNNTAELYDWEYEWLERKSLSESCNQSSLDKRFKKKSGKSFNIIDINNINAINYMKQDDILSKNLDYIDKHRVGEIAVCDGKLAGYIFVTKSGEIQPIHIFEEYRGYGLSNTLMKDSITKYGAKKLGVYSDNLVAIKLYKKFGFKVVGNKVYKDGSEILFMERK